MYSDGEDRNWREWACFVFTDNLPETQALQDRALRELICRNIDQRLEPVVEVATPPTGSRERIMERAWAAAGNATDCRGRIYSQRSLVAAAREALTILEERFTTNYYSRREIVKHIAALKAELSDVETP